MRLNFYVLLIIIVFSCKKDESSSIEVTNNNLKRTSTCNLKNVNSISFEIDNSMSYRFISHQVFTEDSKYYLAVGDLNTNGISILSFKDKRVIKKIEFKATGPDGIASVKAGRNFYYHNKDSIFIFNQSKRSIYLTNDRADVYQKYSLIENKKNLGEVIVENRFMPTFYNNILNLCVYPIVPPYKNKSKKFKSIYVDYNILDKKIDTGKLTYKYSDQNNRHPIYHYPSRVDDSLRLIFLHPFKSELKVYDKYKDTLYTKSFNHPYVDKYTPFLESFDKMKRFDVESTLNNVLLFNKKQQLYYVITELGIPFVNPNNGEENAYEEKPFSVIVFDKNLQAIAHKKFKGGQYFIQNSFAGLEGLYLNTNNPYNPNFNENTYSYHIYNCE